MKNVTELSVKTVSTATLIDIKLDNGETLTLALSQEAAINLESRLAETNFEVTLADIKARAEKRGDA